MKGMDNLQFQWWRPVWDWKHCRELIRYISMCSAWNMSDAWNVLCIFEVECTESGLLCKADLCAEWQQKFSGCQLIASAGGCFFCKCKGEQSKRALVSGLPDAVEDFVSWPAGPSRLLACSNAFSCRDSELEHGSRVS